MVNIPRRLRFFIFSLILLAALAARAKDLGDYNVGDTAEEDITTPVVFDIIDPVATIAKKNSEAAKMPVIFRYCPAITNDVVNDFLNGFGAAHTNFLSALDKKFHQSTLDEPTIASPDFNSFLGAFNKKNKAFPLTTNLAKLWAHGDSGEPVRKEILKRFAEAQRRPIHADALPEGLTPGETVRIVAVKVLDEPLTLAEAAKRGKLGTQTAVTTLTHARSILRKSFPDDEQVFAHAMMALMKPSAIADVELTKQSRDNAVAQIAVPVHYDAGQVIVHRGEKIDETIKVALDALKKNAAAIQMLAQAKKAQQQAKAVEQQAILDKQAATKVAQQARSHEAVLFAEIGGVAVFAMLAVVVVFYLAKARQPAISIPANGNPEKVAPVTVEKPQPAAALKISIPLSATPAASPLANIAEPRTLQEKAEAEILQLTQRLDKIFAPPYDRLRTYQLRLEDYERELGQHNVQEPELLRLKIVTLQRQIETDRKRFRL